MDFSPWSGRHEGIDNGGFQEDAEMLGCLQVLCPLHQGQRPMDVAPENGVAVAEPTLQASTASHCSGSDAATVTHHVVWALWLDQGAHLKAGGTSTETPGSHNWRYPGSNLQADNGLRQEIASLPGLATSHQIRYCHRQQPSSLHESQDVRQAQEETWFDSTDSSVNTNCCCPAAQ